MHESATQAPDKLRPAAGGKRAARVFLADTDSSFECGPRETFLRAALKAGLAVPYECASGACGSCKARLLEGAVEMRWQGATGLSERDRKRGDRILCCQSIPTTDCVIQWGGNPGNREPAPDEVVAEVRTIEDLCPGMRRLTARLEREVFALPGQFMLFDFGPDVGFRAYSMANGFGATDEFEFLIKAKPGGPASEILFQHLRDGDTLKLEGPYGRGYLRPQSARPIVAVAGGSGLAPMLSIVRSALVLPVERDVRLFFGVNRREEMFFERELRKLSAEFDRFHLTIALRERASEGLTGDVHEGLVGDRMLEECPDLGNCDLYCAGPRAMIDSLISQTIGENRIPADRVFFDRF